MKPFAFHRDFHSWSELVQGGFRHGIGTWEDENNEPAFTVSEEYHERESALFDVEESKVPYRARENYVVNDFDVPPIPGSARFALYEEFAGTGLITNTSETAYVVQDRVILSNPAYKGRGRCAARGRLAPPRLLRGAHGRDRARTHELRARRRERRCQRGPRGRREDASCTSSGASRSAARLPRIWTGTPS